MIFFIVKHTPFSFFILFSSNDCYNTPSASNRSPAKNQIYVRPAVPASSPLRAPNPQRQTRAERITRRQNNSAGHNADDKPPQQNRNLIREPRAPPQQSRNARHALILRAPIPHSASRAVPPRAQSPVPALKPAGTHAAPADNSRAYEKYRRSAASARTSARRRQSPASALLRMLCLKKRKKISIRERFVHILGLDKCAKSSYNKESGTLAAHTSTEVE